MIESHKVYELTFSIIEPKKTTASTTHKQEHFAVTKNLSQDTSPRSVKLILNMDKTFPLSKVNLSLKMLIALNNPTT